MKSNRNAMATVAQEFHLHELRDDPDGDVWWEGMTEEPPARVNGLAAAAVDAGVGRARLRIPTRDSPRRRANARRLRRNGRIRRACRSTPFCLADGAPASFPWLPKRSTGSTARFLARRPAAKPQQRRQEGRRSCGAIRWRCFPSAATTWATISRTGSTSAQQSGSQIAQDFLRELVPTDDERQISCGPGMAKTAAC